MGYSEDNCSLVSRRPLLTLFYYASGGGGTIKRIVSLIFENFDLILFHFILFSLQLFVSGISLIATILFLNPGRKSETKVGERKKECP